MVDTGILFSNMKSPSQEYKMTLCPLTSLTYQPIRFSTNYMTLIPSLAFIVLRVVSIEHLQRVFMEHLKRVWHASRERCAFQTHGSFPHSGPAYAQIVEARFP